MRFDDLLFRYFGTREIGAVSETALQAGVERMEVDFGMASDPSQRFALWCLLHMLGSAPDLDVAFETAEERDAARNFMDLMASGE